MKKEKILITGGAGYIGSCLSSYLKYLIMFFILIKNQIFGIKTN